MFAVWGAVAYDGNQNPPLHQFNTGSGGWSVVYESVGVYRIEFDGSMDDIPVVVVTGQGDYDNFYAIDVPTKEGFKINIRDDNPGVANPQEGAAHFFAISRSTRNALNPDN